MVPRMDRSGEELRTGAAARERMHSQLQVDHGAGAERGDFFDAPAAPPQLLAAVEGAGFSRETAAAVVTGGRRLRHRRGWLVIGAVAFLHVLTVASLLGSASGQASTLEGIYRYGHITWERMGDEVEIMLQTAFRRSSNNELFRGTAPDGLAAVGDVLTLYGKEPPQLLYGDESVATVLRMTVTAYSVTEDWVLGELKLKHKYRTPNDGGRPWLVQYVGCCRLSSLANNADANWAVTAEIDLLAASRSPRAATLPMISVPLSSADGGLPSVTIPTQEARGLEWGEGKPFYVGSVLALSGGAYLSVGLGTAAGQPGCDTAASGAGCLFQLLRADAALPERSLTVEGWVKPNSTAGGYALAAGEGATATLLVHVGGSYITVGHDWAAPGGATRVEARFMMPRDVTREWVHVAVRRTTAAAAGGTCLEDPLRPTVMYHVWADGEALWEEGLAVQESNSFCGPHASLGEETLLAGGALRFGSDGAGAALEGELDEWRVWGGAVPATNIVERMGVLLTPEKEAFLGDPTTATEPLLALYHMDPPAPCDAHPCRVAEVVPLYPRGAAGAALAAVTMGGGSATTAEPDSTGVMGWESAVAGVMAGAEGKVTLDPRYGAGQYQVTLALALAGGRARVTLDFVVTVLDAVYDAASGGWQLCQSGGECAHAGNEWVPTLMVRGFARRVGECAGQMAPAQAGVAAMDLGPLLFPCSLTAFTGFPFSVTLSGMDPQEGSVGFTVGSRPAGMELAVHATSSAAAAMEMAWQPCAADEGTRAICVAAVDRHGNATRGASSPMQCLQLRVERDPPPAWDTGAGRTPMALPLLTMGEAAVVDLYATDANCLDRVRIEEAAAGEGGEGQVALPPGAVLHEPAGGEEHMMMMMPAVGAEGAGGSACVGTHQRVTWTPSYMHGGWKGRVCFAAVDSGGGCGGAMQRAVHCIGVEVRRCVYALQPQQQLQEVAGMFGTDWMRLWSLNADLRHPDFLMYEGPRQTLNVGHLYQAAASERAGAVVQRMGMDLAQLHMLNFDIEGDAELAPGQHLCVIPNSCAGAARTHYSSVQYADGGAFFVKYKADEVPLAEGEMRQP